MSSIAIFFKNVNFDCTLIKLLKLARKNLLAFNYISFLTFISCFICNVLFYKNISLMDEFFMLIYCRKVDATTKNFAYCVFT